VDLVDDRDSRTQARHQLVCELEREIRALGPDVKQEISGRRDSHAVPFPEDGELVQLDGAGLPEEEVPGLRAEAGYT
jgi:hypothetical protein